MAKFKISNVAKEDLIRIHHYGVTQFGIKQADNYFDPLKSSEKACMSIQKSKRFNVYGNIYLNSNIVANICYFCDMFKELKCQKALKYK